jgi:hypothetical protein
MAKSKSRCQHEKETLDISKGTEERIRRRAYVLHLERGGAQGFALDDWLRAEAEILGTAKQANVKAAAGSN